jgi:hypothetical protein
MAQESYYDVIVIDTPNKHTTREELLEVVFSVRPNPRLYNEDQRDIVQWQRVHSAHRDLDAVTARIYSCWN